MSGYFYKELISYLYNNPLLILNYALLFAFITLFINKVKSILYIIILLAILALGLCFFTNNLIYFLLGIELYSLLYLLLLYNTLQKYIFLIEVRKLSLLSMIIGSIMTFGTTLVFLQNNFTYIENIDIYDPLTKLGLSLILIGILFKLCAFPFHIWVLDIYKKAPYYIVLISDCLFKLILLQILLYFVRIFKIDNFNNIFIIFGSISMFLGIILSIKETNIKRFLGLFNISHIGLILFLISINNIDKFVTTFGYLLMYSTCPLLLLLTIKDNTETFRNFKQNNINISTRILSIISLLAMICIPPFHTFLSKVDLILLMIKEQEYTILTLSTMYFLLEIVVTIIKIRFIITTPFLTRN